MSGGAAWVTFAVGSELGDDEGAPDTAADLGSPAAVTESVEPWGESLHPANTEVTVTTTHTAMRGADTTRRQAARRRARQALVALMSLLVVRITVNNRLPSLVESP